jgi:hypothetical protein
VHGRGSGILVRDILHAILSAIASAKTQKPILRMALAVTEITLAVPTMHPLNALPASLADVLEGVNMPAILQFLVQRGMLTVSFEKGRVPAQSMAPSPQVSDPLYHSADFACTYLNRFFSDGYMKRGRRVDLIVQNQETNTGADATNIHSSDWKQYEWSDMSVSGSGEDVVLYDRQKVVNSLLKRDTWVGAEESLRRIFLGMFTSPDDEQQQEQAGVEPSDDSSFSAGKTRKYTESSEYCDAWRRMMDDIRSEKKSRQVVITKRAHRTRVIVICTIIILSRVHRVVVA